MIPKQYHHLLSHPWELQISQAYLNSLTYWRQLFIVRLNAHVKNIWELFKQHPYAKHTDGYVSFSEQKHMITMWNGSTIVVRSMEDDPEKLRWYRFTSIIIDECISDDKMI